MTNTNWGAIPRSLAESVSLMLNKKLGVSTGFKPSEWANAINLLGELPVKTASGAIASFSDGADDVPISDCKFYFSPKQASGTPSPSNPLAITGWQGLTVYHTGKNLINKSDFINGTIGGSNGVVTPGNTKTLCTEHAFPIKGNQSIVFSCNAELDARGVYCYASDGTFLRRQGSLGTTNVMALNLQDDVSFIRVTLRKHDETDLTPSDITSVQVEYTSGSASTYEAYNAETKAVTWTEQGTIYGGSIDNNGLLTIDYPSVAHMTENLSSWATTNTSGVFQCSNIAQYRQNAMFWCDKFEWASPRGSSSLANLGTGRICFNTTYTNIVICTGHATLEAFKEYLNGIGGFDICRKVITPETVQLSALNLATYYGDNNFWSEGDSTEVTYRRDIELALAT